MIKEIKSQIKVDLDLKDRSKVIKTIKYGIYFLQDIKLLNIKDIISIQLIKKNSYSFKINLSVKPKDEVQLIIIQAVLGDDRKRVGICYRDYLIGIKDWNRLFNIKTYPNGEVIEAKVTDVTSEILDPNYNWFNNQLKRFIKFKLSQNEDIKLK